jgi:hypothetical protein
MEETLRRRITVSSSLSEISPVKLGNTARWSIKGIILNRVPELYPFV